MSAPDQTAPISTDDLRKLLDGATPGPWRILDDSDCHSDDDGNTVSMAIGKRDNHAFALAMHPYSDRRVEANANLIAIAPQLAAEVLALRELIAKGGAA